MRIEIWSDVVCPWCYVGKRRLETALAGFEHADEVEVVYRSFELDPTAPRSAESPGGHELRTGVIARKYGRTEDEMRDMQQQLIDLAAQDGLDFQLFETVHTNTVDAHRVLHLAGERRDYLLEALFRAHFVDGEVVDDVDTLVRIAAAAGLDHEEVRAGLDGDAGADAVRADLLEARTFGVSGVPFFVANRAVAVSGAQPKDVFLALLQRAIDDADHSGPVVDEAQGDSCVL